MLFHRFSFLISKALEMFSELRSMGDQYLQAKAKQDAEALSVLKARQGSIRQTLSLNLKALQRDEIKKTIENLVQNRDLAVSQLSYYLRLTGDSLNKIPDENGSCEDIQ